MNFSFPILIFQKEQKKSQQIEGFFCKTSIVIWASLLHIMCTFLKLNITCIGTFSTQRLWDYLFPVKDMFCTSRPNQHFFFFILLAVTCTWLISVIFTNKHYQVSSKTTLVTISFPPERLSKTYFPSMCYLLFFQLKYLWLPWHYFFILLYVRNIITVNVKQ